MGVICLDSGLPLLLVQQTTLDWLFLTITCIIQLSLVFKHCNGVFFQAYSFLCTARSLLALHDYPMAWQGMTLISLLMTAYSTKYSFSLLGNYSVTSYLNKI